jgi:hypothetical protein
MKITRENLKNIVKETMIEESEYQEFFKRALEKAGKSIPSMSDEEKKAFFNKIEKTWKGRGKKNEGNAFGAAVAKAKKDGDSKFKVGDKEYKVERFGRGDETELDELTKAQEKLPPALKKAIEKKEGKKESVDESINEGPSTEEKRIAMLAVRKQAKYRNVSLEQAIQDQINALEELKRDAKRGKIK